ncbi:MAG TPA: DUF3617 family protein [Caulobacteraceae bacterium]|jgi:hypothetical protein|nr:DUF3617 family protein [Caulobacteraceae bacterium]
MTEEASAMRATHCFLSAAAFVGLAACNHPQSATSGAATVTVASGPQQAAGLWSQNVADSHGVQSIRYCLDGGAASALAAFDRQLSGRCSKHAIAQAADGTWRFSTTCDMGLAGKVATEGVMRGDFRSHYFIEAQSQTIGAADATANGPNRVLADMQRLGECPRDMKPGDVVMPDGSHSRLDALAAQPA